MLKASPVSPLRTAALSADHTAASSPRDQKKFVSATRPHREIAIGLLTGAQDWHYAYGLAAALASAGIRLDLVGGAEVERPEFRATRGICRFNLRGDQQRTASAGSKALRIVRYYLRLIRYAGGAEPKLLHILWNNKWELFDRTLLVVYYKLLGKKVALTAHNVNAARRDSTDSWLNRLTLKMQYRLVDHIFVHTEKMKRELAGAYKVSERRVTVIPYGINNAVPATDLTPAEAKQRLGLSGAEKVILFLGSIAAYKGLHHLIDAFAQLPAGYRLLIAGEAKPASAGYLSQIREAIQQLPEPDRVLQHIGFVADEQVELYLKAADVLALPYTEIFQSGILFLAFRFGLPVIATDVGSFRDDVIEGRTGYLSPSSDPRELALTIKRYFESELFRNLDRRRPDVIEYAECRHGWDEVGRLTCAVFENLLAERQA